MLPLCVEKMIKLFLPKGRFTQNVFVLVGGAILGQAIAVLVSPILTRLYSPEDFGVFGVYASILSIVTVVASMRYEFALPLPEDDETAANALALCFLLLLGMTGLVALLIQRLGDRIVAWANVLSLRRYLWLVPLGMLGAGTYQILNHWAVRKRAFPRIARTRISRSVGRAAIQISVGFAHPGPLGLLLGQLAGETAGSASLGLAVWTKDRACFKALSWHGIYKAATKYKRFPIFSSWASLLNALGLQMPQILFAAFYGPEVAGWLILAQRVIGTPLDVVTDSVAQVYFGEAVQLQRADPKALRNLFFRLAGRLALVGGLPVVIVCALAPRFFSYIFGQGWETTGHYLQIMGLMFAARLVIVPLSHTLNILERQDWQAGWDISRLLLVTTSVCITYYLGGTSPKAVFAYAISMFIAYGLLFALNVRSLNAHAKRKDEK